MTSALHSVAAFLVTLVGYSGGAVLAASARRPRPGGWELPLSAAAAGGATLVPDLLGAWIALPAAVVSGGLIGATARGVDRLGRQRRPGPGPGGLAPASPGIEPPGPDGRADGDGVDPAGSDVPAHLRFLLRLGDYQGQLTMGFLYFGLLAPFAAISRLGEDPFRLEEDRATYWRDRPSGRGEDREQSLQRQS